MSDLSFLVGYFFSNQTGHILLRQHLAGLKRNIQQEMTNQTLCHLKIMTDPKYAPYKCCCKAPFWNKEDFYNHLTTCTEAREFLKVTKQLFDHYRKLSKYLHNPEEFT